MPPTTEPSSVPFASSCSCDLYKTGPDIVLCYNSTKPNEYFGVYLADDTTFINNTILKNPNFPGASVTPNCNSIVFDNKKPISGNGVGYKLGTSYYNLYVDGGIIYLIPCTGGNIQITYGGSVTCPNSLLNNQGVGSLQETSEMELPNTTKDSKIIIGVVVSIILTMFCAAVLYILYRKYKINNNVKENRVYDLDIFYNTNNYEKQHYSRNPMDSSVQSSEPYHTHHETYSASTVSSE